MFFISSTNDKTLATTDRALKRGTWRSSAQREFGNSLKSNSASWRVFDATVEALVERFKKKKKKRD